MPKEQPCLSEHSPCALSSKNAKDKSNSTTLLAMRDTKDADESSGRGSRCSSEKDSGYSDGSDWQQTDVEDQQSNKSQSRGSGCVQTPAQQPGKNQEVGQGNPGNPTKIAPDRDLTPIYIIKNMVLKQPDTIQKTGQLRWETGSSGVPRVILCQQPSLLPASLQLRKPSSRSSVTGKKTKGLPVFNYPRIAPHPSKKPPDKSSSNVDSQNLSKRVCTEHKSEHTPENRSPPQQLLNKQPKLAVSASGQTCSSSPRDSPSSSSSPSVSSSQSSPSVSTVHTATSSSSSVTARGPNKNTTTTSARHRRFLNTVEILQQSGLLDITLRTKELLQQSNATERDIAQLRQHTELLCEAARNPNCSFNGITAWECLHRAMAESSNYPDLKLLQNLQIPLSHPDSAGQPESVGAGDTTRPGAAGNSNVPSSGLLRSLLDPNQNQRSQSEQSRRLKAGEKTSDKVTFMPPDSSTG